MAKMTNEELIIRLNSIEKRIFALQRDLPDMIMQALREAFQATKPATFDREVLVLESTKDKDNG